MGIWMTFAPGWHPTVPNLFNILHIVMMVPICFWHCLVIANHDEERAAKYFGSWWRADAAALLTFTLPGMRFYWMWQFEGFKNKLDIHLRRELAEAPVSDTQLFYSKFLSITNTDVFNFGNWVYLNVFGTGMDIIYPLRSLDSSWRLIAYRWEYQSEKRLCVINYRLVYPTRF